MSSMNDKWNKTSEVLPEPGWVLAYFHGNENEIGDSFSLVWFDQKFGEPYWYGPDIFDVCAAPALWIATPAIYKQPNEEVTKVLLDRKGLFPKVKRAYFGDGYEPHAEEKEMEDLDDDDQAEYDAEEDDEDEDEGDGEPGGLGSDPVT